MDAMTDFNIIRDEDSMPGSRRSAPLIPVDGPHGKYVSIDTMYLNPEVLQKIPHKYLEGSFASAIRVYCEWYWRDDEFFYIVTPIGNEIDFVVGHMRCGGCEFMRVKTNEAKERLELVDTMYYVS